MPKPIQHRASTRAKRRPRFSEIKPKSTLPSIAPSMVAVPSKPPCGKDSDSFCSMTGSTMASTVRSKLSNQYARKVAHSTRQRCGLPAASGAEGSGKARALPCACAAACASVWVSARCNAFAACALASLGGLAHAGCAQWVRLVWWAKAASVQKKEKACRKPGGAHAAAWQRTACADGTRVHRQ